MQLWQQKALSSKVINSMYKMYTRHFGKANLMYNYTFNSGKMLILNVKLCVRKTQGCKLTKNKSPGHWKMKEK